MIYKERTEYPEIFIRLCVFRKFHVLLSQNIG